MLRNQNVTPTFLAPPLPPMILLCNSKKTPEKKPLVLAPRAPRHKNPPFLEARSKSLGIRPALPLASILRRDSPQCLCTAQLPYVRFSPHGNDLQDQLQQAHSTHGYARCHGS
jgi:hypothetical protein